MLANLNIILAQPRFPENIGMVARACANMGCNSLSLVNPELYIPSKALPLATTQGDKILKNMLIFSTIGEAISDSHCAWCATARLGGWRKIAFSPWKAAQSIVESINNGKKVSIVFGPEDKGLTNEEISRLDHIIHIPCATGATSLNLAQAVLIVLYECRKAALESPKKRECDKTPNTVSLGQLALLEDKLRRILARYGCFNGKNSSCAFIRWHNMLTRAELRQHEFDALMGLMRQMENMAPVSSPDNSLSGPAEPLQ